MVVCAIVFLLTIAHRSGRVEGVAGAATVQPNASVRANCVVAALMLQTFVVVNLTLVHICNRESTIKIVHHQQIPSLRLLLTYTRVDDGIQLVALFAVTVETAGIVDADLVAVTGTLVGRTLVDVDALVAPPPEAHLAAYLLRVVDQQRIGAHRVPELSLLHALKVALGIHTDHPLATRGLLQALVDICMGGISCGRSLLHIESNVSTKEARWGNTQNFLSPPTKTTTTKKFPIAFDLGMTW